MCIRDRQMSLLDLAVTGSFPSFTASFGVADSSLATDLTDVIRLADLALLRSKRDGRNRITSAGSAPDGDTDVDAAVTTAT